MAARRPLPTLRRRKAVIVDLVVALVLGALIAANLWLVDEITGLEHVGPVGWAEYVLAVAVTLPLALRRRFPAGVLVVVGAATIALVGRIDVNLALPHLAFLFAVYNLGVHGKPVVRDVTRGVGLGFGLWRFAITEAPPAAAEPAHYYSFGIALYLAMYGVAWFAGERARRRGERERELAARTFELELERSRDRQQAATEERLRIAREIHDVLGHHVSVMGVQAAGAQRVLPSDPDRASTALDAIEQSSRRAMTELQQVLSLLRQGHDGDGRPLHAGPGGLNDLVSEIRQAGVEVTVKCDELPELTATARLAVLRVVQEGLTNVLRHSGPGTSAWVQVKRRGDELEARVEDDGRGTCRGTPGNQISASGKGLLGLRERLALHGGVLEAGPQQPAGFRVSARLPLSTEGPSPVLEGQRR